MTGNSQLGLRLSKGLSCLACPPSRQARRNRAWKKRGTIQTFQKNLMHQNLCPKFNTGTPRVQRTRSRDSLDRRPKGAKTLRSPTEPRIQILVINIAETFIPVSHFRMSTRQTASDGKMEACQISSTCAWTLKNLASCAREWGVRWGGMEA